MQEYMEKFTSKFENFEKSACAKLGEIEMKYGDLEQRLSNISP